MMNKKYIYKVIVICGPTGSGKTRFAINLASKFNAEIVSADSMQVYRYMNIGTAKPTIIQQNQIHHHMVDIIDPDESFDAAKFLNLARASIKRIFKRNRNVFIVGGTGFYIRVLIQGLFDVGSNNILIRDRLKQEKLRYGNKYLHDKLFKIDKYAAKKIHRNDFSRVARALEIFEITGKTISELQNEHRKKPCFYKSMNIGILWSRKELYERINQRVDNMLYHGFIEEVKNLLNLGYSPSLKSMNSLGYRHIASFLNNIQGWDETLESLKRDHRKYAKRQLTWFNADSKINWLKIEEEEKAKRLINNFL